MLDEFREQATFDETAETDARHQPPAPPRGRFLGMTALQRLTIAIMLLALTCLFSALCLLVTQRVVPPFVY